MPPKQRFHSEDIINAAFEVVRKEGWRGLSARSIAKELHSSTRPIYSYLDSMKSLEEEVVKKAIALFNTYLTASFTGDKWLDQAIGYVKFAMEEKTLFRCINDDKHASLQRKNTRRMWVSLGEDLKRYEPFKNLSEKEIDRIRQMRWFFVHGLASLINNEWIPIGDIKFNEPLPHNKISLTDMLRLANQMIYEGLKDDHLLEVLGIQFGETGPMDSRNDE